MVKKMILFGKICMTTKIFMAPTLCEHFLEKAKQGGDGLPTQWRNATKVLKLKNCLKVVRPIF